MVVPSNDSVALYNAIKKMYYVFKIKKNGLIFKINQEIEYLKNTI